VSHDIVLGITS